jgi:hypothetical protein
LRQKPVGTTIPLANERSTRPQNTSKSPEIEFRNPCVDGKLQRTTPVVQIGYRQL